MKQREMLRYRTILIDPPWKTKSGRLTGRRGFADSYTGPNRKLPYPSMTFDQICELRIGELAEDNAHLYPASEGSIALEGAGSCLCDRLVHRGGATVPKANARGITVGGSRDGRWR